MRVANWVKQSPPKQEIDIRSNPSYGSINNSQPNHHSRPFGFSPTNSNKRVFTRKQPSTFPTPPNIHESTSSQQTTILDVLSSPFRIYTPVMHENDLDNTVHHPFKKNLDFHTHDLEPIESQSSLKGRSMKTLFQIPESMGFFATCFAVINLFVGLGLLSKPYALAQGGFLSLIGLFGMVLLTNYTAKLIVRCFDKIEGPYGLSYPNIGKATLGTFGSGLVTVSVTLELIGAILVSIIFVWKNTMFLVPNVPERIVVLLSVACFLPLSLFLRIKDLAFVSFLGFVSSVLLTFGVGFVFFRDMANGEREAYVMSGGSSGWSVAIGIFAISLGGHAVLPSIYRDMKDMSQFDSVLNVSFCVMFCIYGLTGVFGYLRYGQDTDVLVTNNLIQSSNFLSGTAGASSQITMKIITVFVIANSYFSLGPLVAVLGEIPEELLKIENTFCKRVFRVTMLLSLCIVADICMDELAVVEALTGAICTMLTSVICPALFYCLLSWDELNVFYRGLLVSIVVFGVGLGISLGLGAVMSLTSRV